MTFDRVATEALLEKSMTYERYGTLYGTMVYCTSLLLTSIDRAFLEPVIVLSFPEYASWENFPVISASTRIGIL